MVPIRVRGPVSADAQQQAQSSIGTVLAQHRAATGARIRLAGANHPDGPALVQVNLYIDTVPARIQVPGHSVEQTIDAGATRLHRLITTMTTRTATWRPRPWPDPQRRALALPGHGSIARLKSFHLNTITVCQATALLDAMDFDAYLFADSDTGEDAVIYRAGPTGLRLARQRCTRPPLLPTTLPITIQSSRPPRLHPAQAAQRIDHDWLAYVFYTDQQTGRGNLLYRRYDGDLGLIAPTNTQ